MTFPFQIRDMVAAGIAVAAVAALALAGVTQSLGAHPWWAQSVIWIGAPVGVLLALGAVWMKTPKWPTTLGLAVLTAVSFGVTSYGKAGFAASFAEDQFAGQLWYFGWIATAVFATATLTRALSR